MIAFDPQVVQKFASILYSRARWIIFVYTLSGLIIGGVGGFLLGALPVAAIGTFVVGLLGYLLGTQRAFMLKLAAQQALCQVQIEANTHQTAGSR